MSVVVSVMVTYLAQSTLWLGGAWVLCQRRTWLAPRSCNFVCRMALVGPVITTAVQSAAGPAWTIEPPAGRLALGPAALVVALLALVRLVRLVRAIARARARFRGLQRRASDPRATRLLQRLCRGTRRPLRPRLGLVDGLSGPIAFGMNEICLPAQVVPSLSDRTLAAVLAHELAHLERRDNLWLAVAASIEAALFFQPLNRLGRRLLQDSAELASDRRAVELTGDSLGLARCLADLAALDLATAATGGQARPAASRLLASPATPPPSRLVTRVHRLLEEGATRQPERPLAGPLISVALAILALAIPALRLR
jgi:beta-lactamase regulating signal transducer with metallopeptidase domain